jgi:hypoxanthine phosphoribosyltransferase
MSHSHQYELISWGQINGLCRTLVNKIRASGFAPDRIVAIGRGGYAPARIIADLMGLMDLVGIRVEHYQGTRMAPMAIVRQPLALSITGKRILLLDDVSDTGDTFDVALRHLQESGKPTKVHTAALHHKIVSRFEPDFYARKIIKWRWIIYPWAVVEDLTALAREMQPVPSDPVDLGRRLLQERGIKAKRNTLEDVLALLESEQANISTGVS